MPDIASFGIDEYGQPSGVRARSRVGDIVFSPLATPRAGTLVCDGSAVSRQTYSELFDFLGTACGEGDGSTTFNLPDLRDVWILCAGTEHEAGDNVAEGLPNILGRQDSDYHWETADAYGAFYFSLTDNMFRFVREPVANAPADLSFDASRANAIYGASEHVTPKSTVLTPCIIYE